MLLSLLLAFGSSTAALPALSLSETPSDAAIPKPIAPADKTVRHINVGEVAIELWHDDLLGDRYRIALDGQNFSRERGARFEVHLQSESFDPVSRTVKFPEVLAAHGNLHIVQFETQSLAVYRDALTQLGAVVRNPLHYQAHVVAMDADTVAEVRALPFVRWVGPYSAGHRIEPALLGNLLGMEEGQRYNVQVFERGLAQKSVVAERLQDLGGEIVQMIPDGFLVEVRMSPELLLQVAAWNEVLWIDRVGEFEVDMSKVRVDGGANFLEANMGLTGQGVNAEVMDGDLQVSHQDLQSNPVQLHTANVGTGTHGTKTTGVVFGDGSGSASARGILPDAHPIFADFGQFNNRYAHTADLLQPAYEAVFQSNSWGSSLTSSYNSVSMELDDILFLNDLVILQSQSNTGSTSSRPQAWAKNIVSVGAVRHQDTQTLNDDSWGGSGSIGPAQDGRIKPDIAYWYDSIRTTTTGNGYTNSFGGTSAATPMSAGYFGLFFQLWHTGLLGNTPDVSVFASRPKATTARAIMFNSARSYDFVGTNSDMTRTHQGWGRVNVEDIFVNSDEYYIVNEELALTNMEVAIYNVTVDPGTPELRVTLVYLDPAGTTSSGIHRINDLSLRVTSPTGTASYWGNNGLRNGNWSTTGGTSNDRDVVENVFVQNPAAGLWTVEVIADEIVQDAHAETPGIDADFALVVRGVSSGATIEISTYCAPAQPNSSGFPVNLSGAMTSPNGSGLHLEAILGPASQFGYFLVGTGGVDPGAALGSGRLCLDTSGGNTLGRYNVSGGALNSIGVFGPFGSLQNLAGTSSVGTGFDVPLAVPNNAASITVGSTWYFQLWYRDNGGQSNLSNGLQVTF
ncbi:MAG: S8 family serine peptidase [Planctomycetes bacterium]|nr:S8 family serine peptidase [Planctomycetota bacterium]